MVTLLPVRKHVVIKEHKPKKTYIMKIDNLLRGRIKNNPNTPFSHYSTVKLVVQILPNIKISNLIHCSQSDKTIQSLQTRRMFGFQLFYPSITRLFFVPFLNILHE